MQGERVLYTDVHLYMFANHVAAMCASSTNMWLLTHPQINKNNTTTTTTTTTQKFMERDSGGIWGNGVSMKMWEQAQKVCLQIFLFVSYLLKTLAEHETRQGGPPHHVALLSTQQGGSEPSLCCCHSFEMAMWQGGFRPSSLWCCFPFDARTWPGGFEPSWSCHSNLDMTDQHQHAATTSFNLNVSTHPCHHQPVCPSFPHVSATCGRWETWL